jgi:GPH family glycoside/pentoside/hexuronide:cation symporter
MSGFLMLPMALFADVVDYDEKLTGFRREGIYFGVQSIFQKISIGFSVALAGTLMYAGGQNKPTEFGLKGIALAAGICAVLAFIAFLRYPLRDKNGVISERK